MIESIWLAKAKEQLDKQFAQDIESLADLCERAGIKEQVLKDLLRFTDYDAMNTIDVLTYVKKLAVNKANDHWSHAISQQWLKMLEPLRQETKTLVTQHISEPNSYEVIRMQLKLMSYVIGRILDTRIARMTISRVEQRLKQKHLLILEFRIGDSLHENTVVNPPIFRVKQISPTILTTEDNTDHELDPDGSMSIAGDIDVSLRDVYFESILLNIRAYPERKLKHKPA